MLTVHQSDVLWKVWCTVLCSASQRGEVGTGCVQGVRVFVLHESYQVSQVL